MAVPATSNRPTRLAYALALLGTLGLPLVSACGNTGKTRVIEERMPVYDTGASARVIMPGEAVPMGTGGGGGAVSLGGSRTQIYSDRQTDNNPEVPNWIKAPAGAGAYPVTKAYEAATGGGEEAAEAPERPLTRAEKQAARERAQLEALEQQLGQTSASRPTSSASGAGNQARPAPNPVRMSIADELAALRSGEAPSPRVAARPEPAPATPVPAVEAARPAHEEPGQRAHRIVDRDGDGRIDHWIYREQGTLVREVFDEDADGAADRIVHYEPETGLLAAIEEDSDQDGVIDAWTEYQAGDLHRRRADSDGDRAVDTWTFYRGGQIARHDQDSDRDGFRDRSAFYDAGRLLREEEDRDGDGRSERITWFDAKERPVRIEEDTDGDGVVDQRSFYERGKLARREIIE